VVCNAEAISGKVAGSAGIQCQLTRLHFVSWDVAAIVREVPCNGEDAARVKRAARKWSAGLLAVLLAATVSSVFARELNVQEAVAQAQRETEGKVLSVQTLNVGKHKVYRIKILTRDGQVRIVQVPAEQ